MTESLSKLNGQIQSEFEKYGAVTDVYNTGKGYAFVTFDNKEDASTVSGTIGCDTSSGATLVLEVCSRFDL